MEHYTLHSNKDKIKYLAVGILGIISAGVSLTFGDSVFDSVAGWVILGISVAFFLKAAYMKTHTWKHHRNKP